MYGQQAIYLDIADGVTVNLDLGQYSRFGGRGGKATLYLSAELINQARVTVKFGSTDAITRGFVPVAVAAGRVVVPDDLIASGYGKPGDPITITVENTSAAAAACEIYGKLQIS